MTESIYLWNLYSATSR